MVGTKSGGKRTIDVLERAWTARNNADASWEPFGDGWSVYGDAIDPVPLLNEERQCQERRSLPIEIDEDCREILERRDRESPDPGPGPVAGPQRPGSPGGDRLPEHGSQLPGEHFHCYRISRPSTAFWKDWRNHADFNLSAPDVWWCSSLSDAANKYSWSNHGVGSFANLALAVQSAIANQDDVRVAAICRVILTWGGTRHRANRFVQWVDHHAQTKTLCQQLVSATKQLLPQSGSRLLGFDGNQLFMDSSSTKVYAAVATDLSHGVGNPRTDVLIYDSRVAASIGLITRQMLSRGGWGSVPVGVRFPVQRGARDPSCQGFQFPKFSSTSTSHLTRAEHARTAARYIQEIIRARQPSRRFIEMEKALFMIGYDIRQDCNGSPYCP